jgi:hypothetical protein
MAGNAIGMLETARGMLQNAPAATRLAISTDSAAINKESKKKGGG